MVERGAWHRNVLAAIMGRPICTTRLGSISSQRPGTSPIATRYKHGASVAHDRCSSAPSIRSSGCGERLRSRTPERPLLVRLAGVTPPSIRSSGPSFDLLQVPCVPTDARPQTHCALLNKFVRAGCCFWLLFAHHGKIC
jgi:hypothetical protein